MNTNSLNPNRSFITYVKAHWQAFALVLLCAVVFAVLLTPMLGVAAQSDTINLDTSPLFTAINEWIPRFMPIVAIGGGISIAIALCSWIISLVLSAVRGGGARSR